MNLTRKQRELLAYIERRSAQGECPSFDEMKDALGLRSKSNIHRLVQALEDRGHIHRLTRHARSISLGSRPPETFPNASITAFEDFVVRCLRAGIDPGRMQDVLWREAARDRIRRGGTFDSVAA